ncbi:MAG: peptidoglycan DD-metalloendopeptidase family protein [Chloroflexia bacterium]
MARLPRAHGGERKRPAAFRFRLYEALAEAQSSLEQFSGIHSQPRRWPLAAQVRRLALELETRVHRPAVWMLHRVRPVPARSTPSRPVGKWTPIGVRLATHLVLLFFLALFLFGGFQGALAQAVGTDVSPDRAEAPPSLQEGGSVFDFYDALPAMPVVVRHPRPSGEPPLYVEEPARTTTPLRTEVITYTVQKGDTLTSIAAQFGLHIETLYWYNNLKSADLLSIGQQLRIPEVDGLLHEVKEGETLESIAETYGVRKGNLIAYAANHLREPYILQAGQKLFVPGASKPIPRPAVTRGTRPSYVRLSAPAYAALPGGERFSWPVLGRITDRFGWTGKRWHTGLDIATSWGTPIYSAAAGTVISAGWHGDLGYMVAIDHGEGWVTRYGHMAGEPVVSVGQWVERGQLIGYIGCTGWCTGPHVHFEILYNGAYTDPLSYLQ